MLRGSFSPHFHVSWQACSHLSFTVLCPLAKAPLSLRQYSERHCTQPPACDAATDVGSTKSGGGMQCLDDLNIKWSA